MRRLKIFVLSLLCLSALTACSRHNDADSLWLPMKGLTWGMEKEEVTSLLEGKGVTLQQEEGTVPNRYVLGEMQTCWGLKGTVKLDFKSFSEESGAYLTAFEFYPEEAKEDILLKKLSKAFGAEGSNLPGIGTTGLQWDSKWTLSDIPDKSVRQRAEDLIEKIWGNISFHETTAEMSRPLVTARYSPSEQAGIKGSISLSGEYAAVAVFAEENLTIGITEGSSAN